MRAINAEEQGRAYMEKMNAKKYFDESLVDEDEDKEGIWQMVGRLASYAIPGILGVTGAISPITTTALIATLPHAASTVTSLVEDAYKAYKYRPKGVGFWKNLKRTKWKNHLAKGLKAATIIAPYAIQDYMTYKSKMQNFQNMKNARDARKEAAEKNWQQQKDIAKEKAKLERQKVDDENRKILYNLNQTNIERTKENKALADEIEDANRKADIEDYKTFLAMQNANAEVKAKNLEIDVKRQKDEHERLQEEELNPIRNLYAKEGNKIFKKNWMTWATPQQRLQSALLDKEADLLLKNPELREIPEETLDFFTAFVKQHVIPEGVDGKNIIFSSVLEDIPDVAEKIGTEAGINPEFLKTRAIRQIAQDFDLKQSSFDYDSKQFTDRQLEPPPPPSQSTFELMGIQDTSGYHFGDAILHPVRNWFVGESSSVPNYIEQKLPFHVNGTVYEAMKRKLPYHEFESVEEAREKGSPFFSDLKRRWQTTDPTKPRYYTEHPRYKKLYDLPGENVTLSDLATDKKDARFSKYQQTDEDIENLYGRKFTDKNVFAEPDVMLPADLYSFQQTQDIVKQLPTLLQKKRKAKPKLFYNIDTSAPSTIDVSSGPVRISQPNIIAIPRGSVRRNRFTLVRPINGINSIPSPSYGIAAQLAKKRSRR